MTLENKLGDLVAAAKGSRSVREYSRDSGVDAAVISKIINGNYVPKKPAVFEALTNASARPQNGVTYKKLLEAANPSKEYQDGIKAGMEVAKTVLRATGAIPLPDLGKGMLLKAPLTPLSARIAPIVAVGGDIVKAFSELELAKKNKEKRTKAEEVIEKAERFADIAKQIIITQIAMKGNPFQVIDSKNIVSLCIKIEQDIVSEYDFRFIFFTGESKNSVDSIDETVQRIVGKLVFEKENNKRVVSIVMDSINAFEHIKIYENKLAYRGNLSVILIDTDQICVVDELFLAKYDRDILSSNMGIM